jgi:hypothetical protein
MYLIIRYIKEATNPKHDSECNAPSWRELARLDGAKKKDTGQVFSGNNVHQRLHDDILIHKLLTDISNTINTGNVFITGT